jgi:hypothetical protein
MQERVTQLVLVCEQQLVLMTWHPSAPKIPLPTQCLLPHAQRCARAASAAAARAPVASLARTAVSPVSRAASTLLEATTSAAFAAMRATASTTHAQKTCSCKSLFVQRNVNHCALAARRRLRWRLAAMRQARGKGKLSDAGERRSG